MPNSAQRLPPEVWDLVAKLEVLRPRDIHALCLVSRDTVYSCRRRLYRHLRLHDSLRHVRETIKLLKNNPGLAGVVRELELVTSREGSRAVWVDLDVFKLLKNLNKLVLDGLPFALLMEPDRFVALISKHCKSLRVFVCNNVPREWRRCRLPNQQLGISGLEVISWLDTDWCTPVLSPAVYLARTSAATITEISLPSFVDINGEVLLFSLAFPRLRCFLLGPWADRIAGRRTAIRGLSAFVTRHPTLESLSLGFNTYGQQALLFGLPETACPNLKHFHAHVFTLAALLGANVGFFKTLESLSTGYGTVFGWEDDYQNLNHLLAEYGQLAALRSFKVRWGSSAGDSHCIEEYMIHYAESFPNLERWSGSLPWDSDYVMSFYPKLKEVEHNCPTVIHELGDSVENYIRDLATGLPSLERVTFSTHSDGRGRAYDVTKSTRAANELVLITVTEA